MATEPTKPTPASAPKPIPAPAPAPTPAPKPTPPNVAPVTHPATAPVQNPPPQPQTKEALASGATDVKQNREDVTTPAMLPDPNKTPAPTKPVMESNPGRTGGGIVNQVTPPSVAGPGELEQKLMKEKQLKDDKGQPLPPIPQDAHEIAASNPVAGASAPRTPANVQSNVAQSLNTRVNVGTEPNTPVGLTKVEAPAVPHDVIGPAGASGTPGTGDSGVTTGGKTPQNVEKEIVFTVLLADSKLKDMGFTHTVANNNSRQIIAAFASEADAVKYSDVINK